MTLKIIPYLRLFRFPAVFTALADILCGYFIVFNESGKGVAPLFFLLIASAFLYSGGMVMNDYLDCGIDKVERPRRPLPSGEILKSHALLIIIIFFISGMAAAIYAGTTSFYISLLLIISIILYNAITKNLFILGPLNMGACRFFNMFLGMSIALQEVGWKIIFPVLLMIYIAGVTILSRAETTGAKKEIVIAGFLPIGVVIIVIAFFIINGFFISKAPILFLIPFVLVVAYCLKKIYIQPDAGNIQGCVKALVLSVILLDALFLSGFRGGYYGLMIVSLLLPSVIMARFLYIT